MALGIDRAQDPLKLSGGGLSKDDYQIRRAIVRENLSQLTEIRVEMTTNLPVLDLTKLPGKSVIFEIDTQLGGTRQFCGLIVSVEEFDLAEGARQLVFELRPWTWMLTRVRDSRIFQEMSAVEIIEKVFSDHGFSDFKKKLSGTYSTREYCVQYRESDFDFISRLMQEEGIYYFFDLDEEGSLGSGTMVLADGKSAHIKLPEYDVAEYIDDRSAQSSREDDFIWSFSAEKAVKTAKVELRDFDFLNPTLDTTVRVDTKVGDDHAHKTYEHYDYPGHYRKDTDLGKTRAEVIMEAEDARHDVFTGSGNLKTLATGRTYSFSTDDEHGHETYGGVEFLVTGAIHYLQSTSAFGGKKDPNDESKLEFPEDAKEMYSNVFSAIKKERQYRAPLVTPWPSIPGLHTAIVTGKAGEEIWTDEHGRIKVQFHWDRDGQNDEKTTCWIRVVTPWSGKNWGMVHIPRIGQEVVVQFEEGNPDRPICTGMLYNADTMPPYELPANATQSGIKSNSSKGGGGFNELMFEDKKDEELVRFQSEKDYEQIVKNNATVTVGLEKKDEGNLDVTVQNNVTETIKKGDHTFTVETGSQAVSIKTDQTETIEGKSTRTVTGNHAETIKQGNHTTKVSLGKMEMEAMQKIVLKCGASTITLEPAKITIASPMIDVKADAMATIKSPLTTVKGDGILTLKGGITMIN